MTGKIFLSQTALSGSQYRDTTIKLWDVATEKEIHTFAGHDGSVHSVSFSPDGCTALSGSWDETLKPCDVETGKELRTFTGHTDIVRSVALSPDGRSALSGGDDRTLKLQDLTQGH
jgi:WD40 repeat protein